MIDDPSAALAFAPLEARAAALEARDRISLRDYVVSTEIGAFHTERDLEQRLRFSLVVDVKGGAEAGDDVDLILSYDRLSEAIATELAAERLNLLETLAERIAMRLLREPQAHRVYVRIEKLDRGPWELGVEIMREAGDLDPEIEAEAAHPVIVLLREDLPQDVKSQIAALEGPVVLLAESAARAPLPRHPQAALRYGLLAFEQRMWQLTDLFPEASVTGTRTELDWAIRRQVLAFWAPSKLVLDTMEAPRLAQGAPLALWLGQHLGARQVLALSSAGWEVLA